MRTLKTPSTVIALLTSRSVVETKRLAATQPCQLVL
jgi:hypothetical protein